MATDSLVLNGIEDGGITKIDDLGKFKTLEGTILDHNNYSATITISSAGIDLYVKEIITGDLSEFTIEVPDEVIGMIVQGVLSIEASYVNRFTNDLVRPTINQTIYTGSIDDTGRIKNAIMYLGTSNGAIRLIPEDGVGNADVIIPRKGFVSKSVLDFEIGKINDKLTGVPDSSAINNVYKYVDAADKKLTDLINKVSGNIPDLNTGLAGYLKTTGGTITGSLVVSGNLTVNGTLSCNRFILNGKEITIE